MSESVAAVKSRAFAIRIVNTHKYLRTSRSEYVMSKQLLRSGTSIGANLAEAEFAISRSDFLAKQYIALKECAETLYWLRLLYETDYLDEKAYKSLYNDCYELKKLLSASTKTLKETDNA